MNSASGRRLATSLCRLPIASPLASGTRPFSATCVREASLFDNIKNQTATKRAPTRQVPGQGPNSIDAITSILSQARGLGPSTGSGLDSLSSMMNTTNKIEEPYHFHIYAHKHNTHVTVTQPNREAIISVSAGQIGFKKSKRGSYDAAFQLCAYVFDKLNEGGYQNKMEQIEVVLRGFGPGREAGVKSILGVEGKLYRDKIVKVCDATRLKFGGTRSRRIRRLG